MKIKELILYTNNIDKQADFYSKVLGFEPVKKATQHLVYQHGESTLIFENQAQKATPYHFAFNIPSNKELEALYWLKARCPIVPDGGDEIIDFKSWNAKAIYFRDSDDNIVEFIARKNLANPSDDKFGSKSILNISEIGIGASDTQPIITLLTKELKIPAYRDISTRFAALGSETGLFICVNRLEKKWYPPMDEVYPSPFIAKIEINGKSVALQYKNESLMTVQRF